MTGFGTGCCVAKDSCCHVFEHDITLLGGPIQQDPYVRSEAKQMTWSPSRRYLWSSWKTVSGVSSEDPEHMYVQMDLGFIAWGMRLGKVVFLFTLEAQLQKSLTTRISQVFFFF